MAIVVSVLIHGVILLLLSLNQKTKPRKPVEQPKAIIKASMIYRPEVVVAEPELIKPEPIKLEPIKPEPTKPIKKPTEPEAVKKPLPDEIVEKTSAATTLPLQNITTPAKSNKPRATFDPYASMSNMLNSQNEQFVDELPYNSNPTEVTKSVNSSDDPVNKEIFESYSLDPKTKVVKYGKGCVQVQRGKDYNGFDQYNWMGTSMPCGLDDANKTQFKQSMAKFVRPKKPPIKKD
ncbi:MAG: hypothetical protein ACI8WB_001714 [Phenylobacterium sp.]